MTTQARQFFMLPFVRKLIRAASTKRRHKRHPNLGRRVGLQTLEKRQLLAGDFGLPLGATETDTGEFLLGRVAVTPVFFESNGDFDAESQDWTASEIQQTIEKVIAGVEWWADALDELGTVHDLEFVYDTQYATQPVETSYELIDRPSFGVDLAMQEFLTPLGYADSSSLQNAVHRFNNDQRVRLETDFAFTIFIVDSSDDADGSFASGGPFSTAFAYSGGLYLVAPSMRPAATITHEMGHIFYARDEYPGGGSWTDQRGYYNTQLLNASDNPTSGFVQEDSIMRSGQPLSDAHDAHTSPASTFAMIGWQDSDGDGVFDVLDVPLKLNGHGNYDFETGKFTGQFDATAVALMNQNSSGNQSDITLNEVSRLEYRIDGGDWTTVAEPGTPTAEMGITLALEPNFDTIEFRAVDAKTGVTSNVLQGTSRKPVSGTGAVHGGFYRDINEDGQRQSNEPLIVDVPVLLERTDGSPLPMYETSALTENNQVPQSPGMTLSSTAVTFNDEVRGFEVDDFPGLFALHGFDLQRDEWTPEWNGRNGLEATFDETIGSVTVTVAGIDRDSYARIEAYDENGVLLSRETSRQLTQGAESQVTIHDSAGRIKTVKVFGHAGSSIAIPHVTAGIFSAINTSNAGSFRFDGLPDGDYQLTLLTANLTHQIPADQLSFAVVDGVGTDIFLGTAIGIGPRYNPTTPWDVNEEDGVTALDALLVINDLNRSEPRLLSRDELEGFKIDVNNDGYVTALDALLVINQLNRDSVGDSSGEGESTADASAALGIAPPLNRRSTSSDSESGSSVELFSSGIFAVSDRATDSVAGWGGDDFADSSSLETGALGTDSADSEDRDSELSDNLAAVRSVFASLGSLRI